MHPLLSAGSKAFFALTALAALSACTREAPPPCPRVVLIQDASRQVNFRDTGRDLTDVVFQAGIASQVLACDWDDDEVEIELQVLLEAERGPADRTRQAPLSYFVAIATRDERVLQRESFDSQLEFEGNRIRAQSVDELDLTIPINQGARAGDFRIYVGLNLSTAEFRYNQQNRP